MWGWHWRCPGEDSLCCSFGWFQDLWALPDHSSNLREKDTASQQFLRTSASCCHTLHSSLKPFSFMQSGIVRMGGCFWGYLIISFNPDLLLGPPVPHSTSVYSYFQNQKTPKVWRRPLYLQAFLTRVKPTSPLSLFHSVAQDQSFRNPRNYSVPLTSGQPWKCLRLLMTPTSSIPQIKNPKSCLMYPFLYSQIHSTHVHGTSMS